MILSKGDKKSLSRNYHTMGLAEKRLIMEELLVPYNLQSRERRRRVIACATNFILLSDDMVPHIFLVVSDASPQIDSE